MDIPCHSSKLTCTQILTRCSKASIITPRPPLTRPVKLKLVVQNRRSSQVRSFQLNQLRTSFQIPILPILRNIPKRTLLLGLVLQAKSILPHCECCPKILRDLRFYENIRSLTQACLLLAIESKSTVPQAAAPSRSTDVPIKLHYPRLGQKTAQAYLPNSKALLQRQLPKEQTNKNEATEFFHERRGESHPTLTKSILIGHYFLRPYQKCGVLFCRPLRIIAKQSSRVSA